VIVYSVFVLLWEFCRDYALMIMQQFVTLRVLHLSQDNSKKTLSLNLYLQQICDFYVVL